MKKLRLSFTLLNLYNSGSLEDMIAFYFKSGETRKFKGMELGSIYDSQNDDSVIEKGKMIEAFGGDRLKNPIPKLKLTSSYNDLIEFVGEMDVYDEGTIIENKVSISMDSADYARSDQLCFYFALCKAHEMKADKAIINHFDPSTRLTDRTILWNSKEQLDRFVEIMETKGKEIYGYFEQNGLL